MPVRGNKAKQVSFYCSLAVHKYLICTFPLTFVCGHLPKKHHQKEIRVPASSKSYSNVWIANFTRNKVWVSTTEILLMSLSFLSYENSAVFCFLRLPCLLAVNETKTWNQGIYHRQDIRLIQACTSGRTLTKACWASTRDMLLSEVLESTR